MTPRHTMLQSIPGVTFSGGAEVLPDRIPAELLECSESVISLAFMVKNAEMTARLKCNLILHLYGHLNFPLKYCAHGLAGPSDARRYT